MEKQNLCKLATILCSLFAIAISIRVDMITWQWQDDKPMGAVLGILSAVFASQWIYYKKQQDSPQTHRSTWLRRLLDWKF